MGNSQQKETKRAALPPPPPFQRVQAPKDEEGFIHAFNLHQEEEIKLFFDEYGFVVIKDTLTQDQCEATVDEIWSEMKSTISESLSWLELDRTKPETWENVFYVLGRTGILGSSVYSRPSGWKNREQETLHKVFSTIIGEEDLLVSLDRACVMVPTKNVLTIVKEEGKEDRIERKDRPDLRTADKWFHWDLNPWAWVGDSICEAWEEKIECWENPLQSAMSFITEHNGSKNIGLPKVQGLVALVDSREEDGGFITIPGFNKYLSTWVKHTSPYCHSSFVSISKDQPWIECAQKIPMRAGRFPEHRARALAELLPPGFQPSEMGRRLFGLDVLTQEELEQISERVRIRKEEEKEKKMKQQQEEGES